MASLTQVAISTRKGVRYFIYFIIFLIIGRIVLGFAIGVIQKVFPAPPPPATIRFGKLPKIPFPNKGDLPTLTYTVQTPDGNLPNLVTQAKVYFIPQPRATLLALDNAKKKAAAFGFGNSPNKLSDSLYQFVSSDSLSTLEMNIVTGTFSLGYNLNANSNPLNNLPPTAEAGSGIAKNYLTQASLLPDDLTGPVTQEYLKVVNKQLVTAISLSEANLIKINLFRKDYDKIPAVTPNPNQANVWFILAGGQGQGQVIGAQYYYYPIDETQFSTYPLKTAALALKDLQAGKGYVANLGENSSGKITIRRIYLGYYDPDSPTLFYQPVVVFEGDNGFSAYVPAVTSTYYSE